MQATELLPLISSYTWGLPSINAGGGVRSIAGFWARPPWAAWWAFAAGPAQDWLVNACISRLTISFNGWAVACSYCARAWLPSIPLSF
jgi:hypothetical protein